MGMNEEWSRVDCCFLVSPFKPLLNMLYALHSSPVVILTRLASIHYIVLPLRHYHHEHNEYRVWQLSQCRRWHLPNVCLMSFNVVARQNWLCYLTGTGLSYVQTLLQQKSIGSNAALKSSTWDSQVSLCSYGITSTRSLRRSTTSGLTRKGLVRIAPSDTDQQELTLLQLDIYFFL